MWQHLTAYDSWKYSPWVGQDVEADNSGLDITVDQNVVQTQFRQLQIVFVSTAGGLLLGFQVDLTIVGMNWQPWLGTALAETSPFGVVPLEWRTLWITRQIAPVVGFVNVACWWIDGFLVWNAPSVVQHTDFLSLWMPTNHNQSIIRTI